MCEDVGNGKMLLLCVTDGLRVPRSERRFQSDDVSTELDVSSCATTGRGGLSLAAKGAVVVHRQTPSSRSFLSLDVVVDVVVNVFHSTSSSTSSSSSSSMTSSLESAQRGAAVPDLSSCPPPSLSVCMSLCPLLSFSFRAITMNRFSDAVPHISSTWRDKTASRNLCQASARGCDVCV